jgi:hypothetical protein
MKVLVDNKQIQLPDVLIVGAAKSGTTSLTNYLIQHPKVSIPQKEPNFFSFYGRTYETMPTLIRDKAIFTLPAFEALYQKTPEGQVIIDASVSYLTLYKESIENIQKLYGDQINRLKIIIILRNPVDRAFSHYVMFKRNNVETLSFEEAIKPEIAHSRIMQNPGFNYLENSLYAHRVEAYLKAFKNVKIYLTQDLKKPDVVLNDVLSFIGLEQIDGIDTKTRFNQGGIPKNKRLHHFLNKRSVVKTFIKDYFPKTWGFQLLKWRAALIDQNVENIEINPVLKTELLENYFSLDIEKLEKIIHRDLSAWKK